MTSHDPRIWEAPVVDTVVTLSDGQGGRGVIFHPPVLALTLVFAAFGGAGRVGQRLRGPAAAQLGSRPAAREAQLLLERQTYLVSTVMAFVMAVELASLVLFVFNADRMSVMFVGAMCAVGTLNASVYGFPALARQAGGVLRRKPVARRQSRRRPGARLSADQGEVPAAAGAWRRWCCWRRGCSSPISST